MSLASIPPEQLALLPAAQPPPGVKPNFVNPESCGTAVVIGLAIPSAVMSIVVLLRLYTKAYIVRSLSWDDYISVAATIGSLAYFGLLTHAFTHGLGIHQWNVSALQLLSMIKELNAINYLYGPFMFLAKLAICLLFFRLFSPNRRMRWLIYFAIAYNFVLHLAGTLVAIFICLPGSAKFWTCSGKVTTLDIVISGMNIFSDFYLLILPVFAVSSLQMPAGRKLGIIAVFLTGAFACISSILGEVYRVQLARSPDITWNIASVLILAQVVLEIEIAIIVGCLPILPAFFKQKKLFSFSLGSLISHRYGKFRSKGSTPSKDHRSSLSDGTASNKNLAKAKNSLSEKSSIQSENGHSYSEAV